MVGAAGIRRLFVLIAAGVAALAAPADGLAAASYAPSPIADVSAACAGQNAEVESAADPARGYVYEDWMGCSGIGFARSTDGGRTFGAPLSLPGASGSNVNAWDPAVTVAPDGTVYAAFMIAKNAQWYPVVDASFDFGATFTQSTPVVPPDAKNWGDRDFIAVGPDGTVYLTSDYGPERTSVTFVCAQRLLRVSHRRPQRRAPEVDRSGQDVERHVVREPRLSGERRRQRPDGDRA
jgi:hypothetical protein